VIDNDWKEHLREMDDLKQSSQNAVFEQKDPLLIYKLESFNLFKSMLSRINKQVLGMLFKSFIPVENASEVKQAEQPKKVDTSRLKTSRTDDLADAQRNTQSAVQGSGEVQKPAQIKGVVKIGRNDPCPCGSGKKYKSCHGKEELN
jgi:preprotein translocase subunit SecA